METATPSTLSAFASITHRSDFLMLPITVTSVALKKGVPVSRSLNALCHEYKSNNTCSEKLFVLDKTSRDFDRWRFTLELGCIISDETGDYECTFITETSHPKYPMIQARLLKPKT